MSDTEQVIEGLGFFGESPEAVEDQPAAAESAATSSETGDDETEEISVAEALAELDGEAAPETADDPAETIAAADENPENLPPHVLEALRELDELKAEKAVAASVNEDAQFKATWQQQRAANDAFFEGEVERIKKVGAEQGRTEAEIKAAIYDRVELGNGFGIEEYNPATKQWEVYGRIDANEILLEKYGEALAARERAKTQPNAFESLVSQYALDATDRTALAKFINYPPDHLEEIARTLAGKNQRLQSTQTQARDEAVAKVRANLSRQPAPGVPGASPKVRQLKAPTTAAESRQLAEIVSRRLGFLGPTG